MEVVGWIFLGYNALLGGENKIAASGRSLTAEVIMSATHAHDFPGDGQGVSTILVMVPLLFLYLKFSKQSYQHLRNYNKKTLRTLFLNHIKKFNINPYFCSGRASIPIIVNRFRNQYSWNKTWKVWARYYSNFEGRKRHVGSLRAKQKKNHGKRNAVTCWPLNR